MIIGEILPEPAADLDQAQVVVTLRDTSLADAPAVTVAETRFIVSGQALARIPFRLKVDGPVSRRRRYTLAAEVRRHDGPELRSGDLLTTQSIPWTASDSNRLVRLPVQFVH